MKIIIATNQILELLELARQAQANISQKTEIESQDRKDNKSKESQNNQTVEEVNQRLEAEDTEDEQRLQAEIAQLQSQNQNQDDITSTDLTLRPCAKGELYDIGPYVGTAGESRVSHESCDAPSPSRVQSTIVEGGVEGDPVTREIEQGIDIRKSTGRLDDDDHRGAITIKSALKTEGLASPEEPFKEERQVRLADDLDSGQEPPSSREEPAMCGLLTMRAPLAAEQPFTVDDYNALDNNDYSLEELMEELTEEPRVGSVGQQKENIVDLSSVIITATTSELREIDTGPDLDLGALDQMHDLDDFNGIMDEINLTTIDDAEGINFPEPGRDQSSYLPDSSWGPIFGTTMWNNIAMGTITDFVVGHENLAGLLPTRSGEKPPDVQHLVGSLPPSLQEERPLLADPLSPSHQEEPCAPTRALDASNIENYNNNCHFSIVPSVTIDADVDEGEVDEDPPTRSKYDQTNKGESITIMEVIAGTDVKKKDDTVIVATEGDTHGKIIGYNCGYYSDCDYWDAYDIRDENMEIESGTRLSSARYLSPCKALLRAGDFVFTGQPSGG